jgi:hypothetical protein
MFDWLRSLVSGHVRPLRSEAAQCAEAEILAGVADGVFAAAQKLATPIGDGNPALISVIVLIAQVTAGRPAPIPDPDPLALPTGRMVVPKRRGRSASRGARTNGSG